MSLFLHGLDEAKNNKGKNSLLGNKIDAHIQASRYGQTSGISQGCALHMGGNKYPLNQGRFSLTLCI